MASMQHYKKIIAVTFAILILALIAFDVICGWNCSFFAGGKNTLPFASVKMEGMNKCNQTPDHQCGPGMKCNQSRSSSSADQYNCCNGGTQVYQSLFKTDDTVILKKIAPSFIFILDLTDYKHFLTTREFLNPEGIPPKILNKTQGNYLRILISSFLI